MMVKVLNSRGPEGVQRSTHINRRRSGKDIIGPKSSLKIHDQHDSIEHEITPLLTGTALCPNSAPDSLTPKYVNLVRFSEQVPGAVGCASEDVVLDVPVLVPVVTPPGMHCA
jgi:hypothetical protein